MGNGTHPPGDVRGDLPTYQATAYHNASVITTEVTLGLSKADNHGSNEGAMPVEVSFDEAREDLDSLWNQVTKKNETVIIRREGFDDVAMVPASELSGLEETEYLLSTPKNTERLLRSLHRARRGGGVTKTIDELADEVGLGGNRGPTSATF